MKKNYNNGIPKYQFLTVQFLPRCSWETSTNTGWAPYSLNHTLSRWSAASNSRLQCNLETENTPSDINFYSTAKLNNILNNEQIHFQTNALCSHPVQTVIICAEIAKHSQVHPYSWSARLPRQLWGVNNPVLLLPLPNFLQSCACVDAWQREKAPRCQPPARQDHSISCWTQEFFVPAQFLWEIVNLLSWKRELNHLHTHRIKLLKSFIVYAERAF